MHNGALTCSPKFISSFNILCRGQDAASKPHHCANTNVASNVLNEMTTSFIVTLSLLGLVGLLKLWEKYQGSTSDKILQRVTNTRSPSYGLMIILTKPTIEVKTRLENLIEASDYEIEGLKTLRTRFDKWNDKIYFDRETIRKGIIELTDSVVFNDPEFVVITDRDKIAQLSRDFDCKILVGIWERVSWSVLLHTYDKGQLTSMTSVIEDKADHDNMNPNSELLKSADGDKLKVVLMNCGANIKELFDSDDLNVIEYKLKDTPQNTAGNTVFASSGVDA